VERQREEEQKKTVFRERALRLYQQNRQKIVLLRLVQPRFFLFLWAILGGLALLAGLAWSARVPVTQSGVGLVLERGEALPGRSQYIVLSLLPPDSAGQLKPDQRVVVRYDNSRSALLARIDTVEPNVLSPDAIRSRFALTGALAELVREPAAVAVARVEAETGGLSTAAYSGRSFRIDVEIASRRVLNLMPGFRSW